MVYEKPRIHEVGDAKDLVQGLPGIYKESEVAPNPFPNVNHIDD